MPGIHRIKESLLPVFDDPTCWTTVYLVISDRVAIVDTAVPRSAESVVLPNLRSIGLSPERVDFIVNTHGHGDHVGSNVSLREACNAPILIHEADRHFLENGGAWGDEPIPAHRPDRVLRNGDVLDLGSRSFEVVHLPGHSPGSIGLLDRANGTLICGDSLQGLGTTVQQLPLIFDPDAYERTLEVARDLPIEHLLLAHAYRPLEESHAAGADIRAFLGVSARFAAEIDERLLASLRGHAGGATVPRIADDVCRAFGWPGRTRLADISTLHYLERLVRRGQAEATGDGADRVYRAA